MGRRVPNVLDLRRIAVPGAFLVLAYLAAPPPAAAYIDPLSGSIVFQALAAGFMAAYLSFRRFRDFLGGTVRSLMSRLKN